MEPLPSKKLYQPWQFDPASLQGPLVQLWIDSHFIGNRSLEQARRLLETGRWVCSSPNAVEPRKAEEK